MNLERVVIEGDAAYVTYLGTNTSGRSFRNTEYLIFRGGKIASVDVSGRQRGFATGKTGGGDRPRRRPNLDIGARRIPQAVVKDWQRPACQARRLQRRLKRPKHSPVRADGQEGDIALVAEHRCCHHLVFGRLGCFHGPHDSLTVKQWRRLTEKVENTPSD